MKCYNCNHQNQEVDVLCLSCNFPTQDSMELHNDFPMTFQETIASTYIFKEDITASTWMINNATVGLKLAF